MPIPMIVSDYAEIEKRERQWHRRHAIWRAAKAGAKAADIAKSLGVTESAVNQAYRKADYETRHDYMSPLESELTQVEFVDRAQILNALVQRTDFLSCGDLVQKLDREIARLEKGIAERDEKIAAFREAVRQLREVQEMWNACRGLAWKP